MPGVCIYIYIDIYIHDYMIIYTVCISGYVIMYNCFRVNTSTVRNRCVKEQARKRCCFAASNARFYTGPFLPETCIRADEKTSSASWQCWKKAIDLRICIFL